MTNHAKLSHQLEAVCSHARIEPLGHPRREVLMGVFPPPSLLKTKPLLKKSCGHPCNVSLTSLFSMFSNCFSMVSFYLPFITTFVSLGRFNYKFYFDLYTKAQA